MKATIKEAKAVRIGKIWKWHKPKGLGFSDNDAIILNVKTEDGDEFSQTFYCRLKSDGTLGKSINKRSEGRQKHIQSFIKKFITNDANYNIKDNVKKWKGKEVEVEHVDGGFVIRI